MADDPSPSAAMPDEHELTNWRCRCLSEAQLDELEATWRWLEARALQGIAATLNGYGLFTTPEIAHRFSAIVQALSAQAYHQRLLRQWLQCLTEREWLIREGESWRRCRIPLSEIPEPQEASGKANEARRWRSIWKPASPGTTPSSGQCSSAGIAVQRAASRYTTRCIATTPPAPV